MLGQGSPSIAPTRRPHRRVGSLGLRLAQTVLLAICALAVGNRSLAGEEVDLQLRITWGGGQRAAWRGKLLLGHGRLEEIRRLGLEADLPGAMQVDAGQLHFWERTATSFDGFDVRLRADPSSQLTIQLATGAQKPTTTTLPLADFIHRAGYVHHAKLDDSQNRLLVRRTSGDLVRVTFDTDSLVFSPKDQPTVRIAPTHLGLPTATAVRCEARLLDDVQRSVWRESADRQVDENGSVEPLSLTLPLPPEEGVYTLQVDLVQRRFPPSLIPGKSLIQRNVQLMVVDQQRYPGPHTPPDASSWTEVAKIDLSDPSWWQKLNWFPQLGRLAGMSRNPVSNGPLEETEHQGEPFLQLGGGNWYAVPLPIQETGIPHRLELEYPNDVPQTVGLTILEPNAADFVGPLFLDSGIDIPTYPPAESYEIDSHRLLFWPRTKTPWLLITNCRDKSAAVFRGLRVTSVPAQLPPAPLTGTGVESRLLAVYYDKPLFPQNFTAQEALEPSTTPARSLNDWHTFYDGGQRLVQYLKHVGYNAAIVSVMRDGSTLYPSELLQSTPRYDNGAFFVAGQDPVAKDVLEMLFRLFDQAGLTFVPALHFASPLPELQRQLRAPPAAREGIELVNGQGESYVSLQGTRRGLAPYYNPLDERVQMAVKRVVGELVARYSHHASFKGVALQVGASTYLQLPDEEWGQDSRTRRRFQQARERVAQPGATALGADPLREAWLDWRASVLASFHEDLASLLPADSKLYLAMADSLESPPVQDAMAPRLLEQGSFADAMLRQGIDATKYRSADQVVMLRPRRLSPLVSLSKQGADFEINQSRSVDDFFATASAHGALNFHKSLNKRLVEFDAVSPFGEGSTTTWISAHIPPSGYHSRARFTNSLASSDVLTLVEGGSMIPLGQETQFRDLLATYRQLPPRAFQTVEAKLSPDRSSPVVVRTLELAGQTYCYCLNNGPWSVEVTIDIETEPGCRVQTLDRRDLPPLQAHENGHAWRVRLRPYDLQAVVFVAPRARVVDWRVQFQGGVETLLERAVTDITTRFKELRNPKPLPVLSNPSFERNGAAGDIPGWRFSQGRGAEAAAEVDPTTGRRALHLRVTEPRASGRIRSEEFQLPATGRISVRAWIRTADETRQPPLRIAVDLLSPGRSPLQFSAPLGADPNPDRRAGNPPQPLSQQWPENPYLFHISKLPVEGPTKVVVGFDLEGEGDVWIDDVQVYDLYFIPSEQHELEVNIATANFGLTSGNLAECQQYLNGYWPRFLLEFVPLPPTRRVASLPSRRQVAPPPTQETENRDDRRTWGRFLPQLPIRNPFRRE